VSATPLVIHRRHPGAITIKVGVFRPGWTKLLAWTSRARTIRIIR
jgi:hypothetical protein